MDSRLFQSVCLLLGWWGNPSIILYESAWLNSRSQIHIGVFLQEPGVDRSLCVRPALCSGEPPLSSAALPPVYDLCFQLWFARSSVKKKYNTSLEVIESNALVNSKKFYGWVGKRKKGAGAIIPTLLIVKSQTFFSYPLFLFALVTFLLATLLGSSSILLLPPLFSHHIVWAQLKIHPSNTQIYSQQSPSQRLCICLVFFPPNL